MSCSDQTQCIQEEAIARLREQLPDTAGLARLYKVLADETRIKIVYLLLARELCVGHIAKILGGTPSNVSHHLRLLRSARLVKYRRQGKLVFYSLDDHHVRAIIQQGLAHLNH